MSSYAELHCHSNFTFLDGASHPEELVARAKELGYAALALTDRDGLYGAVRLHEACREAGQRGIVGSELTLDDGRHLTLLCKSIAGYRNLSALISKARTTPPRGAPRLPFSDLAARSRGLIALTGCMGRGYLAAVAAKGDEAALAHGLSQLVDAFGRDNVFIEVSRHRLPREERVARALLALAARTGHPPVATNDARYVRPEDRIVHDVLTCIRLHTSLREAGLALRPNAEHYLRSPEEMAALFSDCPDAIRNTLRVAERCELEMTEVSFRLPDFPVPPGESSFSYLYRLVHEGARERLGPMTPEAARMIAHELDVIERLDLAGYFLIVWDIVRFCNASDILCQGRGSAANSIVCFCLRITNVDPTSPEGKGLLFERFLSEERREPPDIDLDIAHERREEAIQYVYGKYGRDHAAMVCEVISFRDRSAIRDVGKALGLSLDQVDRLAKGVGSIDGASPAAAQLAAITERIQSFPRHLSIHVGGMIVTADPISEVVPIEEASMPDRTVVQWDKDDSAAMGLVKIDLLGLGMLTMLQKGIELVKHHRGVTIDLGKLPMSDPAVYEMLQRADTVGVFQVESRAQMNCLPRLKPHCFYDLVVEVALIRPGPIQGEMVHPYLRRRAGGEQVTYPHPSLRPILERTLGVPLFQEQGMRLAVAAAGFTPAEADELRRAMGHKRSRERMARLSEKFVAGIEKGGLGRDLGERLWKQLSAFADYGFPESHAASFALLVYASAHVKRYYPTEFACALLNSQPMGFYSPATIIADARRHGVTVLPPCAHRSAWDCTIEDGRLRIGLRYVRGLGDAFKEILEAARAVAPFASLRDFVTRTRLPLSMLQRLASCGALDAFCKGGRREAIYQVTKLHAASQAPVTDAADLPEARWRPIPMNATERMAADYQVTGLSARDHPMAHLRRDLASRRVLTARSLRDVRDRSYVRVAGLVICRQQPGTAKGFVFLTLEDETGMANVVVRPPVFEKNQLLVRTAPIVMVEGTLEKVDNVINVQCRRIEELPATFADARFRSRDFH